jgi:hypothetical protein
MNEKTILKSKGRRTIEKKHKLTTYELVISCFIQDNLMYGPLDDDPTGIETLVGIL